MPAPDDDRPVDPTDPGPPSHALAAFERLLWERKEEKGAVSERGWDLEAHRAELAAFESLFPLPDDVEQDDGALGGVPVRTVRPRGGGAGPTVFYLHGGGYVRGSVASHQELGARLAAAVGGQTTLVDYRLAPEHPYPAALDDATAAYAALLESGADPAHVVVAGDSAGGGLAVATLLRARDEGTALPACVVTVSPWVDLRPGGDARQAAEAGDPLLSLDELAHASDAYRAGEPATTPTVSPVLADLAGLPPLLVLAARGELLRPDAVELTRRAGACGVHVELVEGPGSVHIWPVFPALPESAMALTAIGAFVRRCVARRPGRR